MPWNVVYKLEQILIDLLKKDVKTISLKDLERLIIKNLGVTRETTIDRDIEILIKLNWIEQITRIEHIEGEEIEFKITYKQREGELF